MKLVAVVEDNPDNRLLVNAILQREFEVVEYDSGASALTGFLRRVPDVVLMDISLPEIDGIEVLAKMKQDPRLASIPVIALTAHAMAGDRENLLRKGFDEYVAKPITDEAALRETVGKLIGDRQRP